MTERLKLPAFDPASVERRQGSIYPAPFAEKCAQRVRRALGDAAGLTQFGVNLVDLPPGALSSQRHWHANEDEFVYVLDGEVVLVTDDGEQVLTAGMAAGFPANTPDGHHLVNRSDRMARYLEMGTRAAEEHVTYSDIDMKLDRDASGRAFKHRDGTPYPEER